MFYFQRFLLQLFVNTLLSKVYGGVHSSVFPQGSYEHFYYLTSILWLEPE